MFTHLHVASGYSFKYGTASAGQLVERAAEFGMSALALTDRDGMAGAIRFVQECESHGVAPILGVNLSFLQKKYRITLLAQAGSLPALYRLVSAVNRDSANEKVLTFETLEKFSEYSSQVLALHGPDSYLASTIAARRDESALSIFHSAKELFADQAIEVISHRSKGDGPFSITHAAKLLGFARKHDIPAVLSNAVRMLDRADGPVADVLDSARLLVPLHQRHVERSNSEAYLKNEAEMTMIADEVSRAAGESNGRELLRTTSEWAQRTILSPRRDVGIGAIHLPEPQMFGVNRHEELANQLRQRSESGLHRYNAALSAQAAQRLEEELATVRTLGYEAYFLAVADITDIARSKGIRVAARGSGAGSLICYLLGISGVEPMSQGLLMERFCSTLRNELPDIDIDVESARRLEIYDAIFERFGPERTATVSMVETYRARHAIRDVGAALGISPMEIDLIAKSLPHIRARNIGKALENLPELKNLKLDTPLMKTAIHLAGRLDGLPRHLSMHPCAVLLSDKKLLDIAPTEINASGYQMVQYDKDDVEAVGLLKLDVLGVRMQSAIAYSLQEIERIEGEKIDIDAIPLDDPLTFDLIKSTRTLGLFQIESPGQRELVGKFAPQTFTDLIIDISLFRPGPVKSDMITPFINTRHGFRSKPVIHPDLDEILHETEGVVVFHEQVIRIIALMTGISLAQADEKRRELGTFESQQEVCDWFYPAAISQGYELPLITQVWEILRAFASFGFCKAHAAAFALPTFQSAWLKSHHTAAFIAGVLTHDPGMYPRRVMVDEARQWGIEIAPIDINRSEKSYCVEKVSIDGARPPYEAPNTASTGATLTLPDARGYAIRMGLADIQGANEREIDSILINRPYVDLADFTHRSGASAPTTKALLLVGAFDSLYKGQGINRRDLLLHFHDLDKFGRNKGGGQMSLQLVPATLEASGLPDLTPSERIRHEVDLTGMDISHHMMEFYGDFLNSIGAIRSSDLIHQRSGATVLVAGVKVALQTPPVRSGRRVMFLTLDDGYGCNDVTFFEDAQSDHANLLYHSWLFLVRGVVRKTGARGISLRALSAWELGESYSKWRSLSEVKVGDAGE
jgi:error-prone DNA polymerase